ncbi:MAG: SDR family NAD(P)-dependent oxidoreductase [Candidatus Thorarchaeota archaeon]|jgi:NAD(P)-dependent dehydrogenase (short-subunit alcohol dehydrogenase family)
MKLAGRAVVVTGAAAGIGEHTAKLLAQERASVVRNDISDAGARVADENLSVSRRWNDLLESG